jgi:hypothetical protein
LIHRERCVDLHLVIHSLHTGCAVCDFHGLKLDVGAWNIPGERNDAVLHGNAHVGGFRRGIGEQAGLDVSGKGVIVNGFRPARSVQANYGDRQ